MRFPDCPMICTGRPGQQISNHVAAKIAAELEDAAIVIALRAVNLLPIELKPCRHGMIAPHVADPRRDAVDVLRPIEGNVPAGADRFDEPLELKIIRQGRTLGKNQRPGPPERGRNIHCRGRADRV